MTVDEIRGNSIQRGSKESRWTESAVVLQCLYRQKQVQHLGLSKEPTRFYSGRQYRQLHKEGVAHLHYLNKYMASDLKAWQHVKECYPSIADHDLFKERYQKLKVEDLEHWTDESKKCKNIAQLDALLIRSGNIPDLEKFVISRKLKREQYYRELIDTFRRRKGVLLDIDQFAYIKCEYRADFGDVASCIPDLFADMERDILESTMWQAEGSII